MKHFIMVVSVYLFFIKSVTNAQSVVDPIINKLIEKGIIESYEAQEVKNEISKVIKKQLDEQKVREDKYKFKISGYTQIAYTIDEKNDKEPLYIKRARVTFSQQITDWVGFNITPDFAKCAEGKSVELKGIYIDLIADKNFAKFRFGQFNQPFGFENQYSSSKKKFVDSVYYIGNVLKSDYDYGISYSFSYHLFSKKLVDFKVALLNGTNTHTEDNNKKDVCGQVVFEFVKDVEVGISLYDRYFGTTVIKNGQHYNVFLKVEKEIFIPVFFTTEYVWGKNLDVTKEVLNLISTLEINPFKETIFKGLSPTFRYEIWDPDRDISDNEVKIFSFGLNYYPHKQVRVLVDYRNEQKNLGKKDNKLNFMLQVSY